MLGRKELRFALGWAEVLGAPRAVGRPGRDMTLDLGEQDATVLEARGGGLSPRTCMAHT